MTTDSPNLLPEGFRDRLPPHAGRQAATCAEMMAVLSSYGYEHVAPPMVEFEDSLKRRMGDGGRSGLLRATDPVSGRTLALRSDITVQIGRLATSRLADVPRPLRLSYCGPILRLRANQLRPERELSQLGAELIGSDNVAAVSEIVAVAVEALEAAGVEDITVDFTLPDLVEKLAEEALPLDASKVDQVRSELDMKDAGALTAMVAEGYLPLLEAMGPFETAARKLRAFDVGGALKSRLAALDEIAARIEGKAAITLDPTERHGFEYQSWLGFTLFAKGYSAALGRGGSYKIGGEQGREEAATGFSLYPDPLIESAVSGGQKETKKLFLPAGTLPAKAAQMRKEGWVAISAIGNGEDAQALGCTHILQDGKAVPLT